MSATITRVLEAVDREAIQREANELRAQLKNFDDLLALLDRIGAQTAPVEHAISTNPPATGDAPKGNGHKRLSEKRDLVLAILRERPGRWTTRDMRDALRERGIEPEAGTPVKNILWQLAKAGEVHASGGGMYEYPALSVSVELDQEAMGV